MKPLYIFDLDGTLALIDHRRSILTEETSNDEKWRRFYDACDKDEPNMPVIRTMGSLQLAGAEVWIFSGRSDEVRGKTEDWLRRFTGYSFGDTKLIMRRLGDHTADDVLKRRWLDEILVDDRERIVAVFDDRQRVVDMWRAAGITCFQVAPGDF